MTTGLVAISAHIHRSPLLSSPRQARFKAGLGLIGAQSTPKLTRG
jgi:hypothetical protein